MFVAWLRVVFATVGLAAVLNQRATGLSSSVNRRSTGLFAGRSCSTLILVELAPCGRRPAPSVTI